VLNQFYNNTYSVSPSCCLAGGACIGSRCCLCAPCPGAAVCPFCVCAFGRHVPSCPERPQLRSARFRAPISGRPFSFFKQVNIGVTPVSFTNYTVSQMIGYSSHIPGWAFA
jgi:hypothetical protein